MQALLIESVDETPVVAQVGGFVRISNVMLKSLGLKALDVANGRMVIEDCYVSGPDCGLVMQNGADVTLRRSVLCRCRQHGIHVSEGSRATLESCSIFDNNDHGIVTLHQSSALHVTRCMISNNVGAGIAVDSGGEGTIEDNDLRNNRQGACLVGSASQSLVNLGSNLTT